MSETDKIITRLEEETRVVNFEDVDPAVQDLLKHVPEDIKRNGHITQAQLRSLAEQLHNIRHGILNKTPMLCGGHRCPQANHCALYQANMAPTGDPCPFEIQFVDIIMNDLIRELKIDHNNAIEMSMMSDLVQAEVMDMRATYEIAKWGFIEEQPVAIDRQGNTITRREEAVAMQIQDRLKARKQRIRRQFLADREGQAKYKTSGGYDPSSLAAKLIEEYHQLKNAGDAQDAEFTDIVVKELDSPGQTDS